MKNRSKKASGLSSNILLLIARTTSIISIFVIIMFMIGEGFNPFRFDSNELLLALFFPILVVAGMIISWKKVLLGGLISVSGLILFYIGHNMTSGEYPEGWAFIVFTLPAFIFIFYSIVEKNKHKNWSSAHSKLHPN